LNDLHKASGEDRKKWPSFWLENKQTRGLIDVLSKTGIPVLTIHGGSKRGTYVCKQLVYAYAMWLSP
jgi:hypothetical protein